MLLHFQILDSVDVELLTVVDVKLVGTDNSSVDLNRILCKEQIEIHLEVNNLIYWSTLKSLIGMLIVSIYLEFLPKDYCQQTILQDLAMNQATLEVQPFGFQTSIDKTDFLIHT